MIAFTLRLVGRSSAWIAPSIVLILWIAVTLGGGGSARSAVAGLFYAVAIWATWMTISTGNLDTDAHRDLLAAACGSASRLHAVRAATVAVSVAAISVIVSGLTIVTGTSSNRPGDFVICALVTSAGGFLGVSFGTLLHRPLLRHRGLTVLFALMLLIATIVSPPTIAALNGIESGSPSTATALALVLGCLCVAVTAVAARIAAARAR
jgi:hypothetical protein